MEKLIVSLENKKIYFLYNYEIIIMSLRDLLKVFNIIPAIVIEKNAKLCKALKQQEIIKFA